MDARRRILLTGRDWAPTIARLALGTILFAHGAQKAFGWFGGFGVEGTLGFFGSIGIPAALGWLVIGSEVLGGIGLLFGAFGRVAAAAAIPVQIGAVALVHWPNGFFMNWGGTQPGEGFEMHIALLALAFVVMVRGSGAISVDRWLGNVLAVRTPVQSSNISRAA